MKAFIYLSIFIINGFLFGQNLNFTTDIVNNTSCGCNYTGNKVVINQFCAQPTYGNGSIYGTWYYGYTPLPIPADKCEGEWIELYNPSPCSSSDISNYIIGTTNNNNPLSFLIPIGTVIPPRGFAIIRGNKGAVPPPGVVDILITNGNNICSQNPGEDFMLPSESGTGGWFALYTDQGIPLEAVKYGPQWPYGTVPPCKPPGNIVPNNTSLKTLQQLTSMGLVTALNNVNPFPVSTGKSYYKNPDGGTWQNNSYLPEGPTLSYGTCNDPANCLQPQYSCNGSITINMTSGNPPYSYNWNELPTNSTNTANNLCAGVYSIIVTDASNVSQSITVTVIDQNFNLNANIVSTSCNQSNGSIHLNPEGNGPFTFTWIPNVSNSNLATNLSSGSYHINVFNGNCNSDTTITIQSTNGVNTNINLIPVDCISQFGTAIAISTGGILPYSILWNTNESNDTISVSGPNTYSVEVTDATGCIARDTIQVLAPIFPVAHAASNSPICEGNTINLSASNSNIPNSIFEWTGPNFTSNQQNPILSNSTSLHSGIYILNVINGNCSSTDTISVVVNNKPIVNATTNSPICEGNIIELFANNNENNTSYHWDGPSSFYSILQNPTINNSTLLMSGNYIITVTSNNCISFDSVYVAILPKPTSVINSNSPICEGKTISLFSTVGNLQNINYNWTGPNEFSSTQQNPTIADALLNMSGIYSLVTTLNGCKDSTSLNLEVNQFPILNFTSNIIEGCQPLTITFTNNTSPNTTSIQWDFGDGQVSNENFYVDHTFDNAGDFSIQLIGAKNGCIDTLKSANYIHIHPNANAFFNTNQESATIESPTFQFINESTNATVFNWTFENNSYSLEANPSYTFKSEPGIYEVILIANNQFNCPDTFASSIQIIEPLVFYIPNTFTPDGDQFNQVFKPIFTSGFDKKNYTLTIFNRWGELIFETKDYSVGWDGMYHGLASQDDTYIWDLIFKDANNDKKYHYYGHVNLLK